MTLDELIELSKRATPGPWTRETMLGVPSDDFMAEGMLMCNHGLLSPQLEANWNYVVAACNTAPALAERLKRIGEILLPHVERSLAMTTARYLVEFSPKEAKELAALLGKG